MIPMMLIIGILWMLAEPITVDPWPVVLSQFVAEECDE